MQGKLAGCIPADILNEIQRRKASGILRLQFGTVTRQIFIDAGVMVRFSASTHGSENMTALMRDRGVVTDEQLREASTAKKPDELLGTTLVRLGFLTRQGLIELTQEHIRRVAHGAMLLKDGTFEFQQAGLPFREQLDTGLSTALLLLEWSRDIADITWIRSRLGPMDGKVRLSPHPPEGYQSVPLNPAEGYTMSRVDGAATMREICIVSPMGEETTLRALFGLMMAGILDVPGKPAVAIETPTAASEGAARPAGASTSTGAVKQAAGARRSVVATRGRRPGGVLKSRVPGNGGAPATRRPAAARTPPRVERVRPATKPDLEQEMLVRFGKMNESDLYAVLGTAKGAGNDDIRRAYYGLAKQFHPDKFTREDMKAKAEKVFAHITQAYSTLGTEEARKNYDEDLAARSSSNQKTIEPADLAKINFKTGKENFSKGHFAEAVTFFRNACDQDPKRAEHWHYLGMTQSKNPRWKKDAEESFLQALKIDPSDADIYAHLGALYARGHRESRARSMYEKALQWDPEQSLAREGLEALDSGGKKGLLSMFKK